MRRTVESGVRNGGGEVNGYLEDWLEGLFSKRL